MARGRRLLRGEHSPLPVTPGRPGLLGLGGRCVLRGHPACLITRGSGPSTRGLRCPLLGQGQRRLADIRGLSPPSLGRASLLIEQRRLENRSSPPSSDRQLPPSASRVPGRSLHSGWRGLGPFLPKDALLVTHSTLRGGRGGPRAGGQGSCSCSCGFAVGGRRPSCLPDRPCRAWLRGHLRERLPKPHRHC